MLAGGKGAFEAGDGRGLGSHTFGDLCLCETCFLTGLEQGIQKYRFFTLNTLDLGAGARALHELLYDLVMSSHA